MFADPRIAIRPAARRASVHSGLRALSVAVLLLSLFGFVGAPALADDSNADDERAIAGVQAVSHAFKRVAKTARPGVVHIRVSGGAVSDEAREFIENSLRRRFGDTLDEEQLQKLIERHMRQAPGQGSGVIFDPDGYVLTNNHVVDGRSDITVVLDNEKEYVARLVGTDPKTDLAVVKIDAPRLAGLRFGDSDKLEVGDWVIAVGSPFGLSQTVTHGIVSAIGRSQIDGVDIAYQNFIQTDASINPGNSGGPLLNLAGEVVGINTAIATNGDAANAGVAFTIPSNMAMKIARELKAEGKVVRGWLGVQFQPLSDEDARVFGLSDPRGVLIQAVVRDSPADKAGLQVEDVVLTVNGERARNVEQMRGLIADIKPDQTCEMKVMRDGGEKSLGATLVRQPDDVRPTRRSQMVESRHVPELGLGLLTLQPGISRLFDDTEQGVLIGELLDSETLPDELQPNRLIVSINERPVRNVAQVLETLAKLGAGDVELQLVRPDGERAKVKVKRHDGRK